MVDKQTAINEMIRVANPGATLTIVVESSEFITLPQLIGELIPERFTSIADPPVDLIPDKMEQKESKDLANGKFWMGSFRKPLT